jgi:hypothetical protein
MPAKPISLGTQNFARKGDAAAYLRNMLERYEVGDRVGVADAEILMAALTQHPNAAGKIGCGISYFCVRRADFASKCFWVARVDGTTEKFSYKSCVYG